MICKWAHGQNVFEFDADTRAEELSKARAWAKENGWKFRDMVKEDSNE